MNDYTIIPSLEIPAPFVVQYWKALVDSDLLRHRLCDVENPTLLDVHRMLESPLGQAMYMLYRPDKDIVAEFALTNFTGKAAMVHFSMHPQNTPQESLHYARTTTDTVLNEWSEQGNPDAPYLYSLYGLTPVTNRAACAFVQRVGFKKVGLLPGGQRQNGSEFVDALITIKERTHGR